MRDISIIKRPVMIHCAVAAATGNEGIAQHVHHPALPDRTTQTLQTIEQRPRPLVALSFYLDHSRSVFRAQKLNEPEASAPILRG